MANIDTEVLQTLKCSICLNYLSYKPIMQKANGDIVCGRCVTADNIEHSTVRIKAYEKLASTHTFPCRYDKDGCRRKVHWEDVREHEEDCSYRPYECFMLPPGSCTWSGRRNQLMEHFTEEHPNNIINISDEKNIDIREDTEINILTTVFRLLFLVQIKYSKTAHKMWYTVRYIGYEKCSMLFKYSLTVLCEEEDIIRKDNVEPQNSVYPSTDKKYEIDFEEIIIWAKAAIIVNIDKKFEPKLWEPIKCILCKKLLNFDFTRQTKDGCYCTECAPDNHIIINTSHFTSYCLLCRCAVCLDDMEKHKRWFCPALGKRCYYCSKAFTDLSYYVNNHKSVEQSGTIWKYTISAYSRNFGYIGILRSCGIDYLIFCELTYNYVWVRIASTINKNEVDMFKCVITVVNPSTSYKEQTISQRGTYFDWESHFEGDVLHEVRETPHKYKYSCQLIIEITRNK